VKPKQELRVIPLQFASEIQPGDLLVLEVLRALRRNKLAFRPGDILVVKHKIVSKIEGQIVDLAKIEPSRSSQKWAQQYGLDARVIEVALTQGRRIVRRKRGVLIT